MERIIFNTRRVRQVRQVLPLNILHGKLSEIPCLTCLTCLKQRDFGLSTRQVEFKNDVFFIFFSTFFLIFLHFSYKLNLMNRCHFKIYTKF